MFCTPAEVTVSGHLPTGPGYFVLPDPTLANDAYKTAPGDDTPLPPLVASMPYLVHLYFADSTSDIAGMLLTNVELTKYRRLEYRAGGDVGRLYASVQSPVRRRILKRSR